MYWSRSLEGYQLSYLSKYFLCLTLLQQTERPLALQCPLLDYLLMHQRLVKSRHLFIIENGQSKVNIYWGHP